MYDDKPDCCIIDVDVFVRVTDDHSRAFFGRKFSDLTNCYWDINLKPSGRNVNLSLLNSYNNLSEISYKFVVT